MQTLWQDLRYAVRMLLKNPGFTLIAVITLALGVGATTAIFSVVNAVLLRPLPFSDSERLVDLNETFKHGSGSGLGSVSVPTLEDWQRQSDVFQGIASYWFTNFNLQLGDNPQRVSGVNVSANYFNVLGVSPALGRAFLPGEDSAGNDRVVILSDGLWRSSFNADPRIINRQVPLNGQNYTVVGVMPPDLASLYRSVQLWSPLVFTEKEHGDRGNHKYSVIGRLKPGITLTQAREQMDVIARRLEQQYQKYQNGRGVSVTLVEERVANLRPALLMMMAAVGFVLLIACTNVANLLLARAAGRYREIAIRSALGAGSLRLVRQFLTEGLLLSILGGTLGVGLAWWGIGLLGTLAFPFLPRSQDIRIDSRVLLFTLLVSVGTSVIFGLVPALQSARINVQDALKDRSNSSSLGGWLRSLLVVAEIAAAFVLLIGAGLLIRSFVRLRQVDPGLKTENVMTAKLSLPREKYGDADSATRFDEQVLRRVAGLPGVDAAAIVSHLPVEEAGFNGDVTIEGKTYPNNQGPIAELRVVSPDYFRATSIPLLRGRFFTDQDRGDSQPVVIINETMAKQIWPGEDPIGKRVFQDPKATVVGIIADVRTYGLANKPFAEIYAPYTLKGFWPDMRWNMRLVVRSRLDEAGLAAALRREVQAVDAAQPVYDVRMMDAVIERTMLDRRLNMTLLAVFAALALTLALIGIYGVMSYTVAQQTREIGIRVALGAQSRAILKLVVGRGMFMTSLGLLIGVGASFALTRFIRTLLFGITATDPLTFVGVAVLLITVALLACYIPARRAAKVDPLVALRYE
jgi:putative ABC transport system permease protein